MKSMIHNSSSDPVLIKKISLKVWSLRDEIESRIQEKIDAGEMVPEALEQKIKELRDEYTKKSETPNNVVALKSSSDLPADGEDEMERAMALAMAGGGEPDAEENTEKESSEENQSNTEVNPEASILTMPEADGSKNNDNNLINVLVEAPTHLSEDKISRGKTILSEISMEKMFFFSNRAYTEGQSIVIQFCIPKTFLVNADVIYCRPFNIKSRIISQNNYTHRMLIKFNFLKEGERALLRQFIQSIEPDIPKIVKKAATQDSNSDESGFNELDDLGL